MGVSGLSNGAIQEREETSNQNNRKHQQLGLSEKGTGLSPLGKPEEGTASVQTSLKAEEEACCLLSHL